MSRSAAFEGGEHAFRYVSDMNSWHTEMVPVA